MSIRAELKAQKKASKRDLRTFGLTLAGILLLIALIRFVLRGSEVLQLVILPVSALFFAAMGICLPPVLRPLHRCLMWVSVVMGWIMTRVVLSIVFYCLLTPIGLIKRLVEKDSSVRSYKDPSLSTYWNYRDPKAFVKEEYERQF